MLKIVPDQPVGVALFLEPGWKINPEAPSYLVLYAEGKNEPVASLEHAALENKAVMLPRLDAGTPYRLQGTMYYCEEKAGSQCLIKSIDATLHPEPGGQTHIEVKLN
jgi:hypothetical protein